MLSFITPAVAGSLHEHRLRAARERGSARPRRARSPGPFRRSAASAAARTARRLDADSARRALAV
jgi:hypothetical protein